MRAPRRNGIAKRQPSGQDGRSWRIWIGGKNVTRRGAPRGGFDGFSGNGIERCRHRQDCNHAAERKGTRRRRHPLFAPSAAVALAVHRHISAHGRNCSGRISGIDRACHKPGCQRHREHQHKQPTCGFAPHDIAKYQFAARHARAQFASLLQQSLDFLPGGWHVLANFETVSPHKSVFSRVHFARCDSVAASHTHPRSGMMTAVVKQ